MSAKADLRYAADAAEAAARKIEDATTYFGSLDIRVALASSAIEDLNRAIRNLRYAARGRSDESDRTSS